MSRIEPNFFVSALRGGRARGVSQPHCLYSLMKASIWSVKALRKGISMRKLLTYPKIAAIFLGVRRSLVTNLPNSLFMDFNFERGTCKSPSFRFMVKPKWSIF